MSLRRGRRVTATFRIEDEVAWVGDRALPEAKVRHSDHVGVGWSSHTRGFHYVSASGFKLSVTWGTGTYSPNRDAGFDDEEPFREAVETAEIACWPVDGEMIEFAGWSDIVHGWCTPEYVLAGLDALDAGWAPVPGDAWPAPAGVDR